MTLKVSPIFMGLVLWASVAASQIAIDGAFEDWSAVVDLPLTGDARPDDSELGAIDAIKVFADPDFIYLFIEFQAPRPFEGAGVHQMFQRGRWDDLSYWDLDVEGDGRWDFRTRMVRGKRPGFNNLMIVSRSGQAERGILYGEGNKNYAPLGPRAFFDPDARRVEQRIPRLALGLLEGRIYLRAHVIYRDDPGGSGKWANAYFPGERRWIALELEQIEMVEDSGGDLGRFVGGSALEPVMLRARFERLTRDDGFKPPSPYIYPRPTPRAPQYVSPSGRGRDASDRKESQAEPIQPVIVIGPQGAVETPSNDRDRSEQEPAPNEDSAAQPPSM